MIINSAAKRNFVFAARCAARDPSDWSEACTAFPTSPGNNEASPAFLGAVALRSPARPPACLGAFRRPHLNQDGKRWRLRCRASSVLCRKRCRCGWRSPKPCKPSQLRNERVSRDRLDPDCPRATPSSSKNAPASFVGNFCRSLKIDRGSAALQSSRNSLFLLRSTVARLFRDDSGDRAPRPRACFVLV